VIIEVERFQNFQIMAVVLTSAELREKRLARWYFGGCAAAMAACITHPLDLIKVHLQTQQKAKIGMLQMAKKIVVTQGFFALYNGISASILRQLTYSTARFGIYEVVKQQTHPKSFYELIGIAAFAGACGGFVGTPGDMINVRMQNDIKLPPEQRRNYKHAIDGIIRVVTTEGPLKLFNGASAATSRAIVMTAGQIASYDLIKAKLLSTKKFEDNLQLHFTASTLAGGIATLLTQPLDVVKTRMMNSKPGEFSSNLAVIKNVAQVGPMGFYKGFIPAFLRLAPHTILTFIFLEQLRMNFGYLPK